MAPLLLRAEDRIGGPSLRPGLGHGKWCPMPLSPFPALPTGGAQVQALTPTPPGHPPGHRFAWSDAGRRDANTGYGCPSSQRRTLLYMISPSVSVAHKRCKPRPLRP
uniref:Uncharacterized protein n=1 Tax=Eutreptiella gymnastica TaxID=73025 RepID=A0A7S4LBA6_9EUGL